MDVTASSQQQQEQQQKHQVENKSVPPATSSNEKNVSKSSKTVFGKISGGIKSFFYLLFWILSLITYLNIFPYIWYFFCNVFRRRQLRKHSYSYGEFVVYKATFPQWFGQLIRSEQANRRRLLQWVQEQIPARKVVDLNRSWSNGVSLCALVEALVPDTCPRYDLLNPETRVNNCRLGMKLIQRGLGIREPMAPEVMADPRRIQDDEMKKYLLCMQYASQTPLEIPEVAVKIPDAGGQIKLEDKAECTANGSGLVLAVVGKRARFNIATQTYKSKHLIVEICGPTGERLRKKLVDIHGGVRGSMPSRQSSKDEPSECSDIVSFSYQCIKTGSYQVNYIPRVVGIFEIAITWGGEHINNSPYNIRAALAKGAEPPPSFKSIVTKTVSFQDEKAPAIPEAVPEEPSDNGSELPRHPGSLALRGRRQSLVRQGHVTKRGDSSASESSASGSLSAFSSMSSSIAAIVDKEGNELQTATKPTIQHQFSRQVSSVASTRGSLLTRSSSVMYGTVDGPSRGGRTKRKILRRIIKGAGGKEELIQYPQEKQKSKTPSEGSRASGGKSSPRAPSPRPPSKPPPPKAPPNKEKVINKYGDRMSKIILGRSLYEVSKKMIMSGVRDKPKPKIAVEKIGMPKNEIPKKSAAVIKNTKEKAESPSAEAKTEAKLSPKTKSQNNTLSANSNTTLTEPGSKSGNKPLVELQQATQEFTPQISRDSDSSNTEREGPLGQEATEQPTKKHHAGSSNPFKPVPIVQTVTAKAENELKLLETVSRNGPDGQEKGEDEEPNYKKITASRSKSWEPPRPSGASLVAKNKKNLSHEDMKENVAPLISDLKATHGGVNKTTESAKQKPKESKSQDIDPFGKPVIMKVRRLPAKRPQANKATQCSAQGIKDETGWVSRRTVFQSKQNKNDTNDSALGESRGSSMLASNTDSRDVDVANWKSVDSKPLKVLEETNTKAETFEPMPFRPRVPSDSAVLNRQRSRSMTRQATFDSGYSDANSHGLSSRGSRDHSNWHSRSASASSSQSALVMTPPVHDKIQAACEPTLQDKPTAVPAIEQTKDQRTSNANDSKVTPTLDIPYLPNSPNSPNSLSPKMFQHDQGSLTVGNALLISSTNPTPGDSPLPTPGQLSTPANSSKSNSPTAVEKPDTFTSMLSTEKSASPIAGMSARDIGEKLVSGDMSLDALLQSLEHDPGYSTREFLRKFRPVRENTTDNLQVTLDQSLDQPSPSSSEIGRALSPRPGSIKSTNSVPLAERCHASGAGLFQGLVNTKNNFQVQTDNAGDGSLGVSIRGPQPHTVVESNVVYTGDDLYEVIYEVNLPGFYVVSVKWDDRHIADSPFIVKVTF